MPSSTTSVLSFAVSEVGSASELQATTPAVSSNVVSSIDVISKTALPTVVAPTSAASVSSDAVVEDSVPEEGEGGPPANAFKGDVTYCKNPTIQKRLSALSVLPDPFHITGCVFVSLDETDHADDTIYLDDVGNGLGSCGEHSEESEMVVALSPAMMADPTSKNPNHNSKCNTYITLYHPDSNEKSQAKVVSTCPGCGEQDVDLSPALFNKIAPGGDGRVKGVAWHWS